MAYGQPFSLLCVLFWCEKYRGPRIKNILQLTINLVKGFVAKVDKAQMLIIKYYLIYLLSFFNSSSGITKKPRFRLGFKILPGALVIDVHYV